MRLYFGGGEIGTHRTLLQEAGVKNVSMSYMGLRRRVKFAKPWLIDGHFEDGVSVFLDSGAYTVNHDEDPNLDELAEIYEHYTDFVMANLDRIDLVSEFDALPLGIDWIEEQRDAFWRTLPREKFMAIWHPAWGIPYLHEMASLYEVIGIPATSLESGRTLRPVLNVLAAQGTRIHGVAMTKIDEMQAIKWDSVASTSWISPQRFGDTIVWTGNELKRYPKKYKTDARKRHRTLFASKGFDADKIVNDDPNEVLRLSIWSWLQFEKNVNKHHGVTPLFSNSTRPKVENPETVVDTPPEEDEPTGSTEKGLVKFREPIQVLPVMGISSFKKDEEDEEEEGQPIVTIRSESSRMCNSCFLANKCPAYDPDSNCAYNIPITIRTREQFRALQYGMLELQAQRVLFMSFIEQAEGGYADANLSKELALFNKMSAQVAEMEKEGFSINLSVKGQGSQSADAGMISRIFGRDVGQQAQQLPTPVKADDYIEVEWTEEGGE